MFTDVVLFEATRKRDLFDAQRIRAFVERNSQRIKLGQTCFLDLLAQAEKNPSLKLPENLGEVSIYSYIDSFGQLSPSIHTFIVLDDKWFLDNQFTSPRNTHLLSLTAFLRIMIGEGLDKGDIPDREEWLRRFEERSMEEIADKLDSIIASEGFQRECREHLESIGAVSDSKEKRGSAE